jgi:4-amino-4-deoxy-L-arabinose transferase-like glycosyltransferase
LNVQRSTPALSEVEGFNVQPTSFPWRSLLALFIALAAQRMFEPPDRNAILGVSLYLAALGLAIWAFARGELKAAPLPASQAQRDPLTIRGGMFLLSLLYGIAAFLLMWDLSFLGVDVPFWPTQANQFNGWNITVWALAIFFFIRAFWLQEPRSVWTKIADSLSHIRITRWGLLVLAVIALTIFFRFYRLSTVLPEMTSDHAEKLWDVLDITNGKYSIFFPRNTGREPLYVYLSALLTPFTGISFLTIKLAAVIGGLLMLPYLYLLGKELGSKRIGLLAVAFAGIAYWPNVIERFALRISFYPLFVAPTLYYLIRGLRRQQRNDFILAGVALGLGLNGYMPFRIMPFAVVAIIIIYLLHVRDSQVRKQTLLWLGLLALTSFMLFIPLARYAIAEPDLFGFRALSRLGSIERPLPGPAWQIFLSNLWNALKEFNWDNGGIWVHSIPYRPALDVVAGVLFLLGVFLLTARYLRSRQWTDLVILLAVPLTQMPSILSLAFPAENPSLNRAAGAIVPAFLLVGVGLDGLMTGLGSEKRRAALGWSLAGILLILSSVQNYDLVFHQYNQQYTENAWNTSEMGKVMTDAMQNGVPADNVWIVPYPYWVDTRLSPIWAGLPGRDIAKPREELPKTVGNPGPKVFMVKIEDAETLAMLHALYPQGEFQRFESAFDSHDFWIFRVP